LICSIIIRTFNEEKHIGRLIVGIKHQLFKDFVDIEIIIVDSGSTDSTVSIARGLGAQILSIRKQDFSFGRALNLGCKNAKGEILVFVSAHVYPIYTNWLDELLAPFENKKVGLVYGRQIGNHDSKFSETQIFSKWFPNVSEINQETPFCNNANCAIRKIIWESISYDESLTGLEDLDWGKKILANGWQIDYNADALIVHVHEEDFSQIKNRYRREAIALKQIIPKVHVGFLGFLKLFISNSFSDFFQASRQGVLFKEFHSIICFRFMQFYGTYLGHLQKGNITKELKNRFYYPNSFVKQIGESGNSSRKSDKKINYN
jgi:rhamnosyltransferase